MCEKAVEKPAPTPARRWLWAWAWRLWLAAIMAKPPPALTRSHKDRATRNWEAEQGINKLGIGRGLWQGSHGAEGACHLRPHAHRRAAGGSLHLPPSRAPRRKPPQVAMKRFATAAEDHPGFAHRGPSSTIRLGAHRTGRAHSAWSRWWKQRAAAGGPPQPDYLRRPRPPGGQAVGSAGPTSTYRMDIYAAAETRLKGMIGKGRLG